MNDIKLLKLPIILPDPSDDDPYAQVTYIFERVASTKSKGRSGHLRSSLNWYRKFLNETANYNEELVNNPKFFLNKYWDEFALVKFETYMSENNIQSSPDYITSSTFHGIIYDVKHVMDYAIQHKIAASDDMFPVFVADPIRETTAHESYTDQEFDQITSVINKELVNVNKIIDRGPYIKSDKGRDPRLKPPHRITICKNGYAYPEGWGWNNIDNLRWYFENVMNCIPLQGTMENLKIHSRFFSVVSEYFSHLGGLNGIYVSWGGSPLIRPDLIMPLLIKFIAETGMNPDSVLDLTIDCYEDEHPVSGVPFIKYYKERSTGEKELHLSLYDKDVAIRELKLEEARIIKRTIERIKQVTLDIREEAPSHLKKKLFIHQLHRARGLGNIKVLDSGTTSDWCKKMVVKYNLIDLNGKPLNFNLVRFRPTRITTLVRRGYDFFEIMSQAGHASITTTLRYLSKRNLDISARREILKALETIHQNQVWVKETKPSYSNEMESMSAQNCGTKIYKGIVSDCRNPFDPPEQVKNSPKYEPNKACTRFNMCLFCKNVIIMKHHLPMLVVYRNQIKSSNMHELPNSYFYENTLDIIEKVLDPSKSEFDESDIESAIESAKYMDVFIDPVTYKAVSEV